MTDHNLSALLPPNLAALGVPRQGDGQTADLDTIWRTPYPVIGNYLKWCELVGLTPFGGGDREEQGSGDQAGYINSGYRDTILYGNKTSAHLMALALDIVVGHIQDQMVLGVPAVASGLFCRLGVYPSRGIIHLDQVPDNWMARHNKARLWLHDMKDGQMLRKSFPDITALYGYVEKNYNIPPQNAQRSRAHGRH